MARFARILLITLSLAAPFSSPAEHETSPSGRPEDLSEETYRAFRQYCCDDNEVVIRNYLARMARVPRRPGCESSPLRDEEKVALFLYTESDYRPINAGLRQGAVPDKLAPHIGVLRSALRKLPVHEGTVYRGVSLPQAVLDTYRPGNTVRDPAFMSTSYEKGGYLGGYLQHLTIRTRTSRKIDCFSAAPQEREALIPPGARFRVRTRRDEGRFSYIELEELDP